MNNKIFLVLMLVGSLFVVDGHTKNNNSSNMAMIDLSPNKPVQMLFSLTLLSINNESVVHRNDVIMLKPGQYQLKFASNINLSYISESDRIIRSKINQKKYQDILDLKVDAGNIYHLAFDASSKKVEDWKPILLSTSAK